MVENSSTSDTRGCPSPAAVVKKRENNAPDSGVRGDVLGKWQVPLAAAGALAVVTLLLRLFLFRDVFFAWLILVPLCTAAAAFVCGRLLRDHREFAWATGVGVGIVGYVFVLIWEGVFPAAGAGVALDAGVVAVVALALCLPAGPLGLWLGRSLGGEGDQRPAAAFMRNALREFAKGEHPPTLFCVGRCVDTRDKDTLWAVAPGEKRLLVLQFSPAGDEVLDRVAVPYDKLQWSLVHEREVFRITLSSGPGRGSLNLGVLSNNEVRGLRNEDAAMDVAELVHRRLAPIAGREAIRKAMEDHSASGGGRRSGGRRSGGKRTGGESNRDGEESRGRSSRRRGRGRRSRREEEVPEPREPDIKESPPTPAAASDTPPPKKQHEPITPLGEDELDEIRDFAHDGEPADTADAAPRPEAARQPSDDQQRKSRSRGGRRRRPRGRRSGGGGGGKSGPSGPKAGGPPPAS